MTYMYDIIIYLVNHSRGGELTYNVDCAMLRVRWTSGYFPLPSLSVSG